MSNYVFLEDTELVLLDGKCSPDVQPKVDAAKARIASVERNQLLEPKLAGLVADVVNEAKENKLLTWNYGNIKSCPYCDKVSSYWPYPRSGRHHRKGEPNYDKPKIYRGVELAGRFFSIRGSVHIGGCVECVEKIVPVLKSELANVQAELPDRLAGEHRWKRYNNRKCTECGWTGHEGQMRQLMALMGGYYPGGCPKCGAENLPFGRTKIEVSDGYTVKEVGQPCA